MEDNTLVQSSFSATINAPIEKVIFLHGASTCLSPSTKPVFRHTALLAQPRHLTVGACP